jgi:hypothetical protein
MWIGHHYPQANTNNVNKTCALQQTTGKTGTKHRLCEIGVNITNGVIFFTHREGWFEGDSTWLIHYKKTTKNTDSHPAVLLSSFKVCAPVVFVWFWLFFSCLRRRGRRYKRGSDIIIFFPNIAFYYYHQMNLLYSFIISKILVYIFKSFSFTNPWNPIEKGCHTNCVTFLAFLTTYFDEHFFWKKIFQWYFVGTGK